MQHLLEQWIAAKEAEKAAVERRREIEDQLLELTGYPSVFEGTKTTEHDGYKIKLVGRFSRKVDAEKLQDIAAEHGLSNHLPHLFRWTADINKTAWDAADSRITAPLLGAITTTPGRPSFTITKQED